MYWKWEIKHEINFFDPKIRGMGEVRVHFSVVGKSIPDFLIPFIEVIQMPRVVFS